MLDAFQRGSDMARQRGRGGRGGRRRRRARVLCCGADTAVLLGGPAMLRKAAVARCKRLLQHSAQVDGPVAVGVPPLGQKPRKNVLPPHGHKRSGAGGCWGRAEQSLRHQETLSVHSPPGMSASRVFVHVLTKMATSPSTVGRASATTASPISGVPRGARALGSSLTTPSDSLPTMLPIHNIP